MYLKKLLFRKKKRKKLAHFVDEDNGSHNKLGDYLEQIKDITQSNTKTSTSSSTSFIDDISDDDEEDNDSRLI